jgi:hypothetical protein
MGTTTVRVPVSGNDPRSSGWMQDISKDIDAGNDVVFVDDRDGTTPVEVSRVQMAADGHIGIYGKGYAAAAAISVSLVAGGFHQIGGIGGIVAAQTKTGCGIHVKV